MASATPNAACSSPAWQPDYSAEAIALVASSVDFEGMLAAAGDGLLLIDFGYSWNEAWVANAQTEERREAMPHGCTDER